MDRDATSLSMGSYQISASSAMADQFLGRGLEEQDLNEDFLKHLLSGTEGFEESLFDPLPVNGGSPGAVPSLPQDDTALLQLLDWTAEQAFSSQVRQAVHSAVANRWKIRRRRRHTR